MASMFMLLPSNLVETDSVVETSCGGYAGLTTFIFPEVVVTRLEALLD
jgi:hypothetical protein